MIEASFAGSEGIIVYHRWDPPGDPQRIVVLVHGYAEHGLRYDHVADVLATLGAVVYAPDHIGHGRSEGERALITDFEHVVDDLRTLVTIASDAHPGRTLVMVGHSMGGLLTARYAQRYPESLAGIVFLGAVIGDWDWAREVLALPELPYQEPEYSGMSRDPEAVAGYRDDPLVYHGQYKRPLLEAEAAALDRMGAEMDRLTMPVAFFHGMADPYVAYQTSQAAVQRMPATDKSYHLYEGARHELVNETNRGEIIAAVAAFVERVAG